MISLEVSSFKISTLYFHGTYNFGTSSSDFEYIDLEALVFGVGHWKTPVLEFLPGG